MSANATRRGGAWSDGAIAAVLALLAALSSFSNSSRFPPVLLAPEAGDVFFSADVPRVFANMTDRHSNHFRTGVHPLFPMVAYPPVRALQLAGFDAITAVRMFIAVTAALWAALLFLVLRRIDCRRLDAVVFTCVGITSAAAMFWFAVPETYALGALTILITLLSAAQAEHRLSTGRLVGLNVMTLGMTLTNWMAGILTTLTQHSWRQTLRIAAAALVVALALTASERAFFSHVRPPFYVLREDFTVYTRSLSLADAGRVALSFAAESVVLPAVGFVENVKHPQWPKMRVVRAGWVSRLAAFGAGTWLFVLALGAISFARMRPHRSLRFVVAGTLAGQLALHLVYGNETFLYSLHWMALLVIVAATGTLTRARPVILLLCTFLIVASGWNNAGVLHDAAAYFGAGDSERKVIASDPPGSVVPLP